MSDPLSCKCKCVFHMPSLVKKYVMALTGLVLVGFVGVHMLGNLQMFEGPEAINRYAHFLQTLPWEFLWGFRIVLVACLVLHFLMGALLKAENYAARPQKYAVNATLAAPMASRTMIYTGVIVAVFFVLHIMQFTLQNLEPATKALEYVNKDGKAIHDVYAMVIWGFSNDWFAAFYIIAVLCVGLHVSHGATSMFQSVGLRNQKIRGAFRCLACCFALALFGGFALLPAAALVSKYTPLKLLPVCKVLKTVDAAKAAGWDGTTPIFVDYKCAAKTECAKSECAKAACAAQTAACAAAKAQ